MSLRLLLALLGTVLLAAGLITAFAYWVGNHWPR